MKIIKYKRMTEVNNGTEEEPNIVQIFDVGGIQCTDDNFDACYTAAQSIAYNDEVTVEDVPDEPQEPTTEQRVSDLEEQIVQADETAIALYEVQEAQEVINAQQDEALMEIYEMIG